MISTTRSRGLAAATAGAFGLALTLAACTPPPSDSGNAGASSTGGTVKEGCEDYTQYGDLTGTTVTVYTSVTAPEDAVQIASYKKYEECTGAKIAYEGSKEFEAQLPVRLQSGNAPDIAYIPQPGLLQRLVADFPDSVKPAPEQVKKNVEQYYTKAWADYGTVDGTLYASPLGANVKSFVWYSPKMFKDAGYEIPTTWAELIALSDKIVADGKAKPWCAGIASGDATGWPATDWLEDVMLRTAGPDMYDKWVKHEIPFNDPSVLKALGQVGSILKNPAYVNAGIGDVASIATTPFNDGGFPILDGQCYMHRQANFYQANWATKKADVTIGETGDVFAFYFPGETADTKPIVGGGEFVTSFADRNEVKQFMAFLSSPQWANEKAKVTPAGWVSANNGLDPENLKSPIDKLSFQLLADKNSVFRFDASDLMPGAVGAGAEWTEMTNWIANNKSDKDVVDAIEAAWPKS
ncbi:MAG TPA: ABC transporter substrate-binding protein [Propionicimonas sp.]|uniref:ABC transporter substrate-binding protein n=1 Tax=Propionicimonas sp. TaxID=1955623 RepID=UPI002F40B23E